MKLGVWLAFLDSWNGNPSRKGGKTIDLYCYIKVLKVEPVYQQMTLSPKLGVLEISTLWHFRLPLLIQMFIKVASSLRLSEIGMPSPILWSHLLMMQRIVLLNSLLWWELGTNSLITGSGEWLSFRRFTSKLSWSWSYLKASWKKKWLCSQPVILTIIFFFAPNFFMQLFNVSILFRQSIRLFHQELWYELIGMHKH